MTTAMRLLNVRMSLRGRANRPRLSGHKRPAWRDGGSGHRHRGSAPHSGPYVSHRHHHRAEKHRGAAPLGPKDLECGRVERRVLIFSRGWHCAAGGVWTSADRVLHAFGYRELHAGYRTDQHRCRSFDSSIEQEAGQSALKSANVDYVRVDKAIGQLSDEELAKLADRCRQAGAAAARPAGCRAPRCRDAQPRW